MAAPGVFLGRVALEPKLLKSFIYFRCHGSFNESGTLPCRIRGKSSSQIGQQDLRFVRRGVSYCSAVAGGFLALPSPSLGVSSLDLGRSRKVSGPFLLAFGLLRAGGLSRGFIPPPPGRAATPPTGSWQGDPTAVRTRSPGARTRPTARSGARPYTAPG